MPNNAPDIKRKSVAQSKVTSAVSQSAHDGFNSGPCIPPTWGWEGIHSALERMAVWCHHSVAGLCSPAVSWKVSLPLLHPASAAWPLGLQGQSRISGMNLHHQINTTMTTTGVYSQGELTDGLIIQQVFYVRNVVCRALLLVFGRLGRFLWVIQANIDIDKGRVCNFSR